MVASLDGQGPTLQALIDAVTTGHGIDLYRRIYRTTGKGTPGARRSTAGWVVNHACLGSKLSSWMVDGGAAAGGGSSYR
jgi:hypothetical protein